MQTVADYIIACLHALGIEYVFGVPGGAIEPIFNAIASAADQGGPQIVVSRHESGAAFMADGYARESKKIGVCIATSGPGVTNMITGVANAFANDVPLLVITGQPQIKNLGRNALQEGTCSGIDVVSMMRKCTIQSTLVSHSDQIEAKLLGALLVAKETKKPVHISIPVDIQRSPTPKTIPKTFASVLMGKQNQVDAARCQTLVDMINLAKSPVIMVGEGCDSAMTSLMAVIERHNCQFVTTPNGKGLIDTKHTAFRGVFGFGGHTSAEECLNRSDLIVAFGNSFSEFNSSGWSIALLNERLVHVDSSIMNLAQTTIAKMHLAGDIATICNVMLAQPTVSHPTISGDVAVVPTNRNILSQSTIKPQDLMHELTTRMPKASKFVADSGNSMIWSTHYLESNYRQPGWFRVMMDFAPMGWAIGAATGIALESKEPVVCITGDGSYLMNGQEITTAIYEKLPVAFVILNDSGLGMVKHGQRLANAARIGYEIPNVDYSLIATAFGIDGFVVTDVRDFDNIDVTALFAKARPFIIDVRVDPEEVPPMNARLQTLGSLKVTK